MKRLLTLLLLLATLPVFAQKPAQTKPPAEAELTKLLNDFLAAASHTPPTAADKQMFDRFFADDVLYTRSAGSTATKPEIMRSLDEPPDPKEPTATFTAEGITVHQYGDFAVIAFRLVQGLSDGTSHQFRNTGTFQRRKGKWQAIAWQATRIPKEAPKK